MCYRPPAAEVEAFESAPAKTRECPECGAENAFTAKKCTECGAKLPPMKLAPKAPAAPGAPKPPAPSAPAAPGAPKPPVA